MNRKWYVLFSIMLVAMLALAACGGGASAPAADEPAAEEAAPTEAPEEEVAAEPAEEEAAEEAPTDEPAEEEAASGDVVTITYLGPGSGAQDIYTKAQIEQFMAENPDIQVNYITGPNDATERYGLYLQTF